MFACLCECICVCEYLRATNIYGYKFWCILKIVDLALINFSDFAITCFILFENVG